MTVRVEQVTGWNDVSDAAITTVSGASRIKVTPSWKKRILLAEHSPIRSMFFWVRFSGIPYWVSMHLARHKVGVEHFVSSQRADRTGIPREDLPQGAPVNHSMLLDAQALVSISRKRLCRKAAYQTRAAWDDVVNAIAVKDREVASVLVPECVYRGFCPEADSCGYSLTPEYASRLADYREVVKVNLNSRIGERMEGKS